MSATRSQPANRLDAALIGTAALAGTNRMLMRQARRTVARCRWEMRRAARLRASAPPSPRPLYRVEHRMDRLVVDLGVIEDVFQHHAPLAPFTSFLRLSGRVGGEVVLIEATSDRVVARRVVASPECQVA